ncbi:MAG: hypothetical protein KDK39_14005 [Leptospiraceae bacterium]|nr:hypothetical protein [Leptospiraceae bacterium]
MSAVRQKSRAVLIKTWLGSALCAGLLQSGALLASYEASCVVLAELQELSNIQHTADGRRATVRIKILDWRDGGGHNPKHCASLQGLTKTIPLGLPTAYGGSHLQPADWLVVQFRTSSAEIVENDRVVRMETSQSWQLLKNHGPSTSFWNRFQRGLLGW